MAIELRIRLPSVDDPGLNFQFVSGKPLNANPIEKPWSVGRHKRWLIGPVVEIVITEEPDVRHEDSSVDVKPVIYVEMVTAPGFRDVFVSIAKIPLADSGATIVARCRGSKQSHHVQDP